MKNIGIVSVSSPGSSLCFQYINETASRQGKHPSIMLHHLSYSEYIRAINRQDWNTVAELLLKSIQVLKAAGADFAIIPANTVHFALSKMYKPSPLPLLSIVDCVTQEIVKLNFKKVAVLGTKFTMENKLYENAFNQHGIAEVALNPGLIQEVHQLILNEIIPNNLNPETVDRIASKLNLIECECFVLACTELPIVFSERNLNKKCIDSTKILADSAFEQATFTPHLTYELRI